ncbi:hypothetical protein [Parasedimentitalea maritima]|uniref:Uncharacterized protein n=1 Tax=Parasedimentitalea maritima TaxID=2578117 RepID=A0A6A4RRK7_9RHOB|nr:hypothetical protein [Zongyanglinia marina]KAE9632834.1 hypothetical protein GP644_03425 [Zongyanglinia marina]
MNWMHCLLGPVRDENSSTFKDLAVKLKMRVENESWGFDGSRRVGAEHQHRLCQRIGLLF